jgi:hypothetical protein
MTDIEISKRIEEINDQIKKLYVKLDGKDKKWDWSGNNSYDDYEEFRRPETDMICKLGREKRMICPYVLSEIPEESDVMSLDNFISNCKEGYFSDYDGSGNYCINGKMTDIDIYPSDIHFKSIRKEFDTIVWFNK